MVYKPQSIAEQIHPQRDTLAAASPCQIPAATMPSSCYGQNFHYFPAHFWEAPCLELQWSPDAGGQATIAMNAVHGWLDLGWLLGRGREGSGKMHGMCFASESLCQVK